MRATGAPPPGIPPGPPHDLDLPLYEVTFCVVDLETTGGSAAAGAITEVGAVKVRGGEVLGEFQTLVDPGVAIPAGIAALTGITDGLVRGRPPIEAVAPAFLEFARGATLVAHNARFDTGFLNATLTRLDYGRLDHPVVCTAALARRLLRDEVRDCKLATLARRLGARTEPTHRALTDARATVDVLHGLLERAGRFGVTTLADLLEFAQVRNLPLYRRRRPLADGLPPEPGVYTFRSASGEVLYVGKATDLRARVRSYFTSDHRRQIADLLKEADRLDHTVCPTPLEAAVRELRLISAHLPRFNRRAPRAAEAHVTLTSEPFPRLSVVRRAPATPAGHLGPLPGRRAAEAVVEALEDAVAVRRCRDRIGPRTAFAACALAEIGRCPAPCERRIGTGAYAALLEPVRAALAGDPGEVLARLDARLRRLAAAGRFEEAAATRDRAAALATAVARGRLRAWVVAAGELCAARPRRGGWDVVHVRAGRLAASIRCSTQELGSAAAPPGAPAGDAPPTAAEIDLVGGWLSQPGVRVLRASGTVAEPIAGGRALAAHDARVRRARRGTGRPELELAAKRLRRAG